MRRNLATAAAILGAIALLGLTGGQLARAQAGASHPVKRFTIVAVEASDVVFWLPSNIEVTQGDRVVIAVKDMLGGPPQMHGFAIPAYHIAILVPKGEAKIVEFTADKAGIFPIICQIHAEHIGGQLVVHPRGAFGSRR